MSLYFGLVWNGKNGDVIDGRMWNEAIFGLYLVCNSGGVMPKASAFTGNASMALGSKSV